MITIQLNGKTREISVEEWLDGNLQDILADDIGFDSDALSDFNSISEDLPREIIDKLEKEV